MHIGIIDHFNYSIRLEDTETLIATELVDAFVHFNYSIRLEDTETLQPPVESYESRGFQLLDPIRGY